MEIRRRSIMATAASAALLRPAFAQGQKIMRVAMTAADLPTVTGIPNNGGEGFRFLGYPAYDSVVNWDFEHTDQTAETSPGLFTEIKIDPKNPLRWLGAVRTGVKFHDGSDFNADAVIWNMRRIFDEKSPQYDAPAAPIVRATVSMIDGYEKVDDSTIAITTKYPFSFLPYLLTRILIASPTVWESSGKSWVNFAKNPSGTGPFKITRVIPGQYVEMTRNDAYWDKSRIPKLDKLVVYPMPEATTRLAALRSGQVDWIEVPPPDAIPSLKAAGFQVSLWPYPHTYPYVLNTSPGSIFNDVRVRQAANYAIDRESLCQLINGTGKPAIGLYPPEHPVFGTPENRYKHDPDRARALLKAAGYGPGGKPAKAKIMISTSGSGQMVPIPMNEFLQQNFKEVGIDIEFDVVEWGTMLVAIRSAPTAQQSHGVDGVNISLSYTDPSSMFRYYATDSFSPTNYNWGHWSSPEADKWLKAAQENYDPAEQTKILAKAHAIIVDEAPWLFICHDLNPRSMSKRVTGFKPAQSWYQDFTHVTMA
jgi:peptide/nickel transport system substrate-binding protein